MSAISYRRLPGKRRTLIGAAALHIGPDHLLQVKSTRLTEEYQRFYFQDVQSIVLRRTAPFHYIWATFLVAIAALAARWSADMLYSLAILGGGGVFLWLRGPACDVRLNTAVTSAKLLSLHRLKTARRVVPMIQEQIEQTQGTVVSVPDGFVFSTLSEPPPLPSAAPAQPLGASPYDHALVFGFIGTEALLLGLWLGRPTRMLEQAVGVATLIEFLALVIILVRQNRYRVSKPLRSVTYVATVRWFLVQAAGTLLAYKAIFIDHTKGTVDPLTIVRGSLTYLTLLSLAGTSVAGLWLAFRKQDA